VPILPTLYFSYLEVGPTVYYGDEKGMTGSGGDKAARQDMFPTQVLEASDTK